MPATRVSKSQLDESEGFKELTYNPDGTVASVTLYATSAKTLVLLTKTFTYVGDNLDSVLVTYPDGSTVTKTFTYDGAGDLESVDS